jgi:hypothetical protein
MCCRTTAPRGNVNSTAPRIFNDQGTSQSESFAAVRNGERLRVGLPVRMVIGHAFDGAAGRGHLLVELRQRRVSAPHVVMLLRSKCDHVEPRASTVPEHTPAQCSTITIELDYRQRVTR